MNRRCEKQKRNGEKKLNKIEIYTKSAEMFAKFIFELLFRCLRDKYFITKLAD